MHLYVLNKVHNAKITSGELLDLLHMGKTLLGFTKAFSLPVICMSMNIRNIAKSYETTLSGYQ